MVLSQMVHIVTVHSRSKRSHNTVALSKNSLNSNLNIVFHAKFGKSTRLLSIGKRFSSSTGLIGPHWSTLIPGPFTFEPPTGNRFIWVANAWCGNPGWFDSLTGKHHPSGSIVFLIQNDNSKIPFELTGWQYRAIMNEVQSTIDLSEVRSLLSLDLPILGDLLFYITNIGLLLILGACFIFTLKILRENIKPLNTNYNKFIALAATYGCSAASRSRQGNPAGRVGNILFKSKEYSYATLHNIIVNFIRMVYIFTNSSGHRRLFFFFKKKRRLVLGRPREKIFYSSFF